MAPPTSLDNSVAVIAAKLDNLHGDVQEIRTDQRELAIAVTKLILIEERQSQAAAMQERMFTVIEKLEGRVTVLEVAAPMQKQTSAWIMSGVWAAAGLAVMFIAKQVGLL